MQISDPARRHAPLPAPALGRHAAARRDRDGAGQGPDAADPRRADDRPRRDGRGRGARPGRGAAQRVRHDGPVHQPQPRRDREDVRPRRRALRRRLVEEGPVARRSSTTRATRTRSGCCAACRAAACARTTSGSTRSRASCPQLGADLPAASSPTAAALAQDICRTEEPPFHDARAAAATAAATSRSRRTSCRAPRRRAGLRSAVDADAEPVIRTRGHEQDLPPGGPRRPRRRRRLARPAPRRDARPGRRVRQRQDDARPRAARPDRGRRGVGRRARRPAARRRRSASATREQVARAADRLPEPGLGAQPALLGPPHPQPRADQAASATSGERARGPPARARRTRCASTRA